MAAGASDPHGDGTMGSHPSQGIFVGGVAIGLLVFMALFIGFILVSAALHGFA